MREARTISHVGSVDLGVGATLTPTRVAHLQSLWEIGGDARILTDSSATNTINAETSIIDGQVVTSPDSDSSTPGVAGLQVQLLATIDTAGQATRSSVTTPDGQFTFDNLTPGDYVLRITSPSLDTIALMIPDRPMHIDRATKLTVTTTLPSITSARRALCGTDVQRGDMVIRGTVRDHTTGKPLSGATVKGYWYDAMNTDQNFSAHAQTAATMTEIDGKYALCIRAARGTLHLSASLGNRKVRDQRLESAPGRIRMLDFIM
ncbi:MAG TPA: carboxypeptidase regulatory-like domain-containing protein, partial [Gemmatimonadaceae bacterium]